MAYDHLNFHFFTYLDLINLDRDLHNTGYLIKRNNKCISEQMIKEANALNYSPIKTRSSIYANTCRYNNI